MRIYWRTRKSGVKVPVVIWKEQGRLREKACATETEARDFLDETRRRVRLGLVTHNDVPTLGEFAVEWWENHVVTDLEVGTHQHYATQLRLRVLPYLGQYKLTDITRRVVSQWKQAMVSNGCTARQVNPSLNVLSGIMTCAVDWSIIGEHPFPKLSRMKEVKRKPTIYPEVDVLRLAGHALQVRSFTITPWVPVRDKAIILVAAFAGLRISEVLALPWKAVEGDWLHISKALDANGVPKPTKSHRDRMVPLLGIVRDTLEAWAQVAPDSEWMFPNGDGGTLMRSNWTSDRYGPARKLAGLQKVNFHHLRHLFASLVIAEGATALQVMEWMGHAKITETFQTYGHLLDHDTDDVVKRLSQRPPA